MIGGFAWTMLVRSCRDGRRGHVNLEPAKAEASSNGWQRKGPFLNSNAVSCASSALWLWLSCSF